MDTLWEQQRKVFNLICQFKFSINSINYFRLKTFPHVMIGGILVHWRIKTKGTKSHYNFLKEKLRTKQDNNWKTHSTTRNEKYYFNEHFNIFISTLSNSSNQFPGGKEIDLRRKLWENWHLSCRIIFIFFSFSIKTFWKRGKASSMTSWGREKIRIDTCRVSQEKLLSKKHSPNFFPFNSSVYFHN